METSLKKPYIAPSSDVVSIRTSGVLCESPNASTSMNVTYLEETI